MNKAFKFRLYPNQQQEQLFAKTFGCVRFIYNRMLSDKINHFEATKELLNTRPAQYKEEFKWLKEVDSLALANAQLNFQTAYGNFFRSPKTGFPKFKSKHRNNDSYTTNFVNGNIKLENGYLALPKIKDIKIKQHRPIPSDYKLKSVTVSRTPTGKYFASILYEFDRQSILIAPKSFIGLDFSMKELYIDSNGVSADYPRYYRSSLEKLQREQRKLSKMKKGSNNRNKQRIKVAKLHEKISNQRKDFLHKQSRQIANAYDCVSVEDLNMKAMSQCLNFGKSVSDNGWGMFTTFLEYKLKEEGKIFIKVDKFFPSSQACSVCGSKNPITKDLKVRHWVCPDCGTHHDRDVNAGINIKNEGMRLALA